MQGEVVRAVVQPLPCSAGRYTALRTKMLTHCNTRTTGHFNHLHTHKHTNTHHHHWQPLACHRRAPPPLLLPPPPTPWSPPAPTPPPQC
jgi:hypothetical protein